MIRLKNTEIDETQVANSIILVNDKVIDEAGAKFNFAAYREIVDFSTNTTLTIDDCKSKLYNFTGSTEIVITLPNITVSGLNFDICTGNYLMYVSCDSSDSMVSDTSSSKYFQLDINSYYSFISIDVSTWIVEKRSSSIVSIFNVEIDTNYRMVNSATDYNMMVSDIDGNFWCWGSGALGQLGNNNILDSKVPVQVCGGHTFCQGSIGYRTNLALDHLGQAWSWGYGASFGVLGDNSLVDKSTPVQVCGGHTFCKIGAGRYSMVALDHLGQAWSWGNNQYGTLGDNTAVSKRTPIQVCGGHTFCQIAAGIYTYVALDHLGQAWSWGNNQFGQLGDNTTVSKSTPVQVCGGHAFCKIAIGDTTVYALKANGEAWAWGAGTMGMLGNNESVNKSTPVQVCGGYTFCELVPTGTTCIAIDNSDVVWTWGYNLYGQFGDGTTTNKCTPIQVCTFHNYIKYYGGLYGAFGVDSNNKIWAWGWDRFGELGVNSTTLSSCYLNPVRLK